MPVRNAAATLPACLEALSRQSVRPGEVIVVDDGSSDGTVAVARRYGVKVLQQDHAGAGAARNRGVRAARGDLLLFTDADCAPVSNWIERLLTAFDDDEVVAVRGVCTSDQTEAAARLAQLDYEEKYRQLAKHRTVDCVATDSAAYRRDVFSSFGGFDEGMAASEDQELSFRFARQGMKAVFLPDAEVRHRHRPSLLGYARRRFWIGYAKAGIGRRHPGKLLVDTYTPQSLKLQVGCAGLTVLGLVLAPIRRRALVASAAGALGFCVSAIPTVSLSRAREPELTARLPALLVLRALALGAGLAAGTVAELRRVLR